MERRVINDGLAAATIDKVHDDDRKDVIFFFTPKNFFLNHTRLIIPDLNNVYP